jgi:hypothetical protein
MNWLFTTLSFFLILINIFPHNIRAINTGDAGTSVPQFQDFYIGLSYQEVVQKLTHYKTTLNTVENPHLQMELPIYELLSQETSKNFIDFKKERIYYDNETFFDFKSLFLDNKTYKFYYDGERYLLNIKDIENFSVDYPSRINPKIISLKFKFFKKKLYAIEYSAKNLTSYEILKIRNNYLGKYGFLLYKDENTFETSGGKYFITIDSQNRNHFKAILMGAQPFSLIRQHLDRVIYQLLYDLGARINLKLYNTGSTKKILLQERKNLLLKKIKQRYGSIYAL